MGIKYSNICFYLACLLVLFYAFFSTPFPVSISLPEIIIGLLSILLVSISIFKLSSDTLPTQALSMRVLIYTLLLLFTGSLPFLYGSSQPSDFIRDVISLLFLLLTIPVSISLYGIKSDITPLNIAWKVRILSECLCIAGLVFAIRSLLADQVYGNSITDIGQTFLLGDLTYKQYDPLVIFCAIYSVQALFKSFYVLFSTSSFTSFLSIFFSVLYRIFCVFTVILSYLSILQRFPVLLIIALIFLSLLRFISISPGNFLISALLLIGIASMVIIQRYESLSDNILTYSESISNLLSQKSTAQGGLSLSYKIFEANAAFDAFNLSDLFFGLGLGSTYYNSEIQDTIRFTHSLISYIPLKFGLLGFFASSFFLFLVRSPLISSLMILKKSLFSNQIPTYSDLLISSSFAPLLMALLQPTYKVLSYSFFLGIILAI